jgi:hypothetical protein
MKTIKKDTSLLTRLLTAINDYRARSAIRSSPYRAALDALPPTLFHYWRRSAQFEFKGIPRDAFFFACAADGLMTFFACATRKSLPCALPSMAADSVWHAWMRLDAPGLERFCIRHFGRAVLHVEGAAMQGEMDVALANCLVQARDLEDIGRAGPNLPRLFTLDRRLKMPGGFAYKMASGEIGYRKIDRARRAGRQVWLLPALSASALLGAGLVSHEDHDLAMRKREKHDGGCGSSCGSSCSSSCGSSCGSGCGGGCGGGGD